MPGGTFIQLKGTGSASSFGKIGITDANGEYTYYSTLSSAVAASTAGDTIVFFTDITESGAVTVTLPDGVDINLNGFKYLLSNAGTNNAIALAGSSTVHIFNGTIARQGGSDNNLDSAAIYITTADKLQLTGVIVENASGVGIITAGGETYGEYKVIAQRGFYAANVASNSIKNAYIISTGLGIEVQASGSGTYINNSRIEAGTTGIKADSSVYVYTCTIYGFGGSGILAITEDIQAYDSYIIGLAGSGIRLDSGNQIILSNVYAASFSTTALYGNSINDFTVTNCFMVGFTGTPVRFIAGSGNFVRNTIVYTGSDASGVSLTLNNLPVSSVVQNTINVVGSSGVFNSYGITIISATTPPRISLNKIYLAAKVGSYGIYSNNPGTGVYYLDNEFDLGGGALPVSPNITQLMVNTPDTYGNILIG